MVKARSWPQRVNERQTLIKQASEEFGVPERYIAAIMAQESQGESVCRTPDGTCCGGNCNCLSNEGVGVMQTLVSTANQMLKRTDITARMLMTDDLLAVRAGAATIKYLLDRNDGDFVKAALGYNAGGVRCGTGKTFKLAGSDWPQEECPDPNKLGVKVGCVYSSVNAGPHCFPAKKPWVKQPGNVAMNYVCTSNYPYSVAKRLNTAIESYPGAAPPPPEPEEEPGRNRFAIPFFSISLGAAAGYFVASKLMPWLERTAASTRPRTRKRTAH